MAKPIEERGPRRQQWYEVWDDNGRLVSSAPLPTWVERDFPDVTFLSVGRCGETGERIPTTGGHTHALVTKEDKEGWLDAGEQMCLQRDYWNPDGPTATFIHEYTHIKTAHDHAREWRKAYRQALKEWGFPSSTIAPKTGTYLGLEKPDSIAPKFLERIDHQADDGKGISPTLTAPLETVRNLKRRENQLDTSSPAVRDTTYHRPRYPKPAMPTKVDGKKASSKSGNGTNWDPGGKPRSRSQRVPKIARRKR